MEIYPQDEKKLSLTCEHQNIEVFQGQKYHFPKGYTNFSGLDMEKHATGHNFERVQCADCKEILEVSAF